MNADKLMEERKTTHGGYTEQSLVYHEIANSISAIEQLTTPGMKQALQMIAVKLSRIVVGNCNTIDHWLDIAGYATRVVEELEIEENHSLEDHGTS